MSIPQKLCLIYGNCQAVALQEMLRLSLNEYDIIKCNSVHNLSISDIDNIYNILSTISLLIIHPIGDNYKNNVKLSTKNILEHISVQCKVIIIPVCYFNFYYPEVIYLKSKHPSYNNYYFDKNIVNLYRQNLSPIEIITQYKYIIENKKFDNLLEQFTITINELKYRENEYKLKYKNDYIIISDFIEQNYKDKLLFYTRNHPTKFLMDEICVRICDKLKLQYINMNIDLLNTTHPPLYKDLQNYVSFDINSVIPRLFDNIGLDNVINNMIYVLDKNIFTLLIANK